MEKQSNTFHILAIPGSSRRRSYNRQLLEAAGRAAPDGVTVEMVDLALIPFYDGDVEAAGDPPAVRDLKAHVRDADALLIATPEYKGAVPGLLQNAIDWASRPYGASALVDKPVAIIGASPGDGGTARAQRMLRQTLTNTRALPLPAPELAVPRAAPLFDDEGASADLRLAEQLREVIVALVDWTRQQSDNDTRAA